MTPGIILGILCFGLMIAIAALMWVLTKIDKERKKLETAKRIKNNDTQAEPWFEQFIDKEMG